MALPPLELVVTPNVDTQGTPLQVGNSMHDSNLIRVKNGYVQKVGGATRLTSNLFSGTCAHILPWQTLNGTQYVALGTTAELAVLSGGTVTNITPAAGVGSANWDLDKWGENLVACTSGSTLYQWVPPVAFGNIAQPVAGAPSVMNGLFVAAPQQQTIAFGIFSATLGAQDPLLIGWCDVADLNTWTATATNQAGTFRLSNGSRIVGGTWFGLIGLIWTDLDLWGMTYSGFPLIYGFNRLGQNCGLISRHALGTLGTKVAWMSQNDFFQYDGGSVQTIPCSVRNFVFDNLDRSFPLSCFCATNAYFDEFTWRFPTQGSAGVANAYVKWNATENKWDKGLGEPMVSAWADQSVLGAPLGSTYTGLVLQFETAIDFDGTPRRSFFETGWFKLGQDFIFVERILPDFNLNTGGQITLTVTVADQIPEDDTDYPVRVYGPYVVTRATPYIPIGCRGRVAKLRIECDAANTTWRYGKPLAVVQPDGSM